MPNKTNIELSEYAILADNVYWDIRNNNFNPDNPNDISQSNWTPVPKGWTALVEYAAQLTKK